MEHWNLLPGVDPKNYLYNRCGLLPCRYVCHVLWRRDFASPGWGRQPDQHLARKASSAIAGFVQLCCHDDKQSTPSAWHTFRSWRIVWRGYTSLLSNSASRSGPRLPDAPCAELVLLPQGRRLVFSPTGKRATKKKGNKKKRINISFRADCKFRAKESTISEPKSLRPFLCAFLTMLRRRRAPSWDLPCVCTLTSSASAGRHLDVFGSQKQTWKRHSRLNN